jgi:phosphoglycerate dehydrogenase-like enzyme
MSTKEQSVPSPAAVAVLDDYQGVALQFADWRVLEGRANVTVFRDHQSDPAAIVERLKSFDVICVMRERTPLTREILSKLPRLRLICSTGQRNASIDMAAAAELGITVSRTGYSSSGALEVTWTLILGLLRHLPEEADNMRSGRWQTTVGTGLSGKTLGLLGLGSLGAGVAAVARAFDMRIIAWSQNLTDERAAEHGAIRVDKETLFSESDVLSVHLVLSKRSRGIVGAEDFARMKPSAYFINTSRGPLVDEAALIDVLQRRAIAGAAVDVYDHEPVDPSHPLRTLDNILSTAHIGFVTDRTYKEFYEDTVDNIIGWLDGTPRRVDAYKPKT